MTNIEHSIIQLVNCHEIKRTGDQVERTTPVCNGSRMTAGGLPVNARSRGRLGVRLYRPALQSQGDSASYKRVGLQPVLSPSRAAASKSQ